MRTWQSALNLYPHDLVQSQAHAPTALRAVSISLSFLSHTRRTGGLKGALGSEPRGCNGCSMT